MSNNKDITTIATDSTDDDFVIPHPVPCISDNTQQIGQLQTQPNPQLFPPATKDQLFNAPPWNIKPIDHAQEINDLKKEIQTLKDMIAEHILLGHQDIIPE